MKAFVAYIGTGEKQLKASMKAATPVNCPCIGNALMPFLVGAVPRRPYRPQLLPIPSLPSTAS